MLQGCILPSDYSLRLVVASKSSSKCPFGSHYVYRNKFKTKFAAIQLPKNTIKFQKRHLNNKPGHGPLIPKMHRQQWMEMKLKIFFSFQDPKRICASDLVLVSVFWIICKS